LNTQVNKKAANIIGTRNESSLHRTLKYQYTGKGGKTEVETGEYVADGINREGEYIEVQTGSFAPLYAKVKHFASTAKVKIIHPIPVKKTIEVYDTKGKLLYRRKSPVKGCKWDIFEALLGAPLLPLIKGLSIEVALVDVIETRVKDGKGTWRRRGISLKDKSLGDFRESFLLSKKSDYLNFVPFKKDEEFTSALFAEKAAIDKDRARKALYVLTKMKLLERKGKQGNSWVYTYSGRNSRKGEKFP
jgi:hypothetical protein